MSRKIIGLFSFCLAIIALAGALKVLNWLPSVAQEGFIREYKDVDDVRERLKIPNVYIPSYFPQDVKWPPSAIWAQTKPFTAIVMEFRNAESGDIELTISQVSAGARFVPDDRVDMERITEKVDYSLKGRNALLEVGVGKDDQPRSRISWTEGKYRIIVAMKSRPFDLLGIAESMLR